eukprot:scaffold21954_cov146-Isochrysis_galbana.AAC.1
MPSTMSWAIASTHFTPCNRLSALPAHTAASDRVPSAAGCRSCNRTASSSIVTSARVASISESTSTCRRLCSS